MARRERGHVDEWAKTPRNPRMDPKVVEAIGRRRRQMLVHSFLYYSMDDSIIDDHTWSKWAQQLARLQNKYGSRVGFYDEAFAGWGGSSGFHLPTDAGVITTARRLLKEVRERQEIIG